MDLLRCSCDEGELACAKEQRRASDQTGEEGHYHCGSLCPQKFISVRIEIIRAHQAECKEKDKPSAKRSFSDATKEATTPITQSGAREIVFEGTADPPPGKKQKIANEDTTTIEPGIIQESADNSKQTAVSRTGTLSHIPFSPSTTATTPSTNSLDPHRNGGSVNSGSGFSSPSPRLNSSSPTQASSPSLSSTSQSNNALPESLSSDPPSRVIHFRNITSEITQGDIVSLATPFGQVEKVVMMRTKNQCLLEFTETRSAIMLINFYLSTQPQIRGRKIYLRFSRHQALSSSNSNINRILLVTLQTEYVPHLPITADVIWQIFSPYGFVEKIVVINKAAVLQTLVQYGSEMSASAATQYLNGKTVYVGTDPILSITLCIQYSNLQSLTVKQNTAESRDYSTPLPWAQPYTFGLFANAPPTQPQLRYVPPTRAGGSHETCDK